MYTKARGRMLKVWAKGECPVCDGELEHSSDDHETDDEGKQWHLDTYACYHCDLLITYVSPADIHEYHQVSDQDKYYIVESRI